MFCLPLRAPYPTTHSDPTPPRPLPAHSIAPPPSILDTVLRPFSSYRHHQVPEGFPPDSPTPVPMPPTGADSNAVLSNQGDTIELVIHSPHKAPLHDRQSTGWFSSFTSGGGGGDNSGRDEHRRRPETQLFSITGEENDDEEERDERVRRQQVMNTLASPSSSDGYDDALSILSASELISPDELGTAEMSSGAPPAGAANNGGAPSGRLAYAFSEKWGAWVKDAASSSDDGSAEGGGKGGGKGRRDGGGVGGGGRPSPVDNGMAESATSGRLGGGRGVRDGGGGRSAREFDHEALLLSPFDPRPVVPTTGLASAAEVDAADGDNGDDGSRFASPMSRSSSSGSVYSERWLWHRRYGVKPPTSSNSSSRTALSQGVGGNAVAGGSENVPNLQGSVRSDTEGETPSRRQSCEEYLNAPHDAAGVGLQNETKAAMEVPPSDAQRHDGTTGESKAGSLLEIEI